MVLDIFLLNSQQYRVRIKGKVEQSKQRRSALPYPKVYKLMKREPSHRTRLWLHLYLYIYIYIYIYISLRIRKLINMLYYKFISPD